MTKKMIEFDLELAKSGKYDLIHRNGLHVLDWQYFEKMKTIGVICDKYDTSISEHDEDGKYRYREDDENDHDLMLIPKKKKVYLRIAKSPNPEGYYFTTNARLDKDEVTFADNPDYQLVEIEIDEE